MEDKTVIIRFTKEKGATIPTQGYAGDAGFDLYTSADTVVYPGETTLVPTGICVALPHSYWAQIISRSSTPRKYSGLSVVEAVIDNGYRGSLFIQVTNPNARHGKTIRVEKGARIAQLVLHQIHPAEWLELSTLPPSARNDNGFGSTGL